MPTRRRPRSVIAASALLAACLPGAAIAGGSAVWTLTVGPEGATSGSGAVQTDLDGFLIGDFDPETNPGGTLTLPGIFGGNGNQPVDISLGLDLGGDVAGTVSGGLQIAGDPESGTLDVQNLQLDLLSGATSVFPLSASLVFETFRSFNPDSLFPGGIPVTVPLGESVLTRLEATQLGAASAVLTPDGSGAYLIEVDVPVLLVSEFEALGQTLDLPPIPAVLPLTGSLTIDAKGTASVSLGLMLDLSQEESGPFKNPVLDGVPFGLPTVLPPGSEAGVLFTLTPESVSTGLMLDVSFEASGSPDAPAVPGDTNDDGVVDFADLLAVLANFGPCGEGVPCPADVNDDLAVDFNDLLIVLANWTA